MALINCVECGKEVSDKAVSCPNCGIQINSQGVAEEYLCCPRCNSKDIHAGEKGFSGGKALAGVVLTGGIGILAGTIGSRDVVLTCLKCGNKFKVGEAKSIKSSEYDGFDYDDIQVINFLKEGKTNLAVECIRAKNKNLNADEVVSITNEYAKRHNIELKPYKTPSGCASVILIFVIIGSVIGFIL